MERIGTDIRKLVSYGIRTGLVPKEDEIFTINRLLELFGLEEIAEPEEGEDGKCGAAPQEEAATDQAGEAALAGELEEILNRMCDYAYENGLIAEDGIVYRDLFEIGRAHV